MQNSIIRYKLDAVYKIFLQKGYKN